MLYLIGRFCARRRWPVALVWAALLLAALPFFPLAPDVLKSGFGEADTPSQRAFDLISDRFDDTESAVVVVFQGHGLTVDDPRYAQEMREVLEPVRREVENVTEVLTYYDVGGRGWVSPDGTTTYALVSWDVAGDEALEQYDAFTAAVGELDVLDTWMTGGVPIFHDVNAISERDLRRAEIVSLPLVLVAMLLLFGGVYAAGSAVAVGGAAVLLATAALYLLGQVTDVSIFALNLASVLGLGIAIDYTLLVINRFREELPRRPRDEAIAVSMATAGKAILFSGLTSVVGFSGLLLFDYMILRSLGLGGIIVIGVSMLLGLTLLPAILAILGPRVNALTVFRSRLGGAARPPSGNGAWARLARSVMRHAVAIAIPLVVLLLLLGAPFLRARLGAPWADLLPAYAGSRQGWEAVTNNISEGALSPVEIVLQSPEGGLSDETLDNAYALLDRLRADPGVERVESLLTAVPGQTRADLERLLARLDQAPPETRRLVDAFAQDDVMRMRVSTALDPVSDEARAMVEELRAIDPSGGVAIHVAGATAELMDAVDAMYSDFPKAIAFIVVAIYVILAVLFRSLILPLKAVVMNTLSLLASFGALVWVFQDGRFQGLLNYSTSGFLELTVPILLFCVIFGVSMDYEVFLLSRVKETYDETGDNTEAVATGLERTGRIITSAALILALVFLAMTTSDILILKMLGLGMAIAVLLDATVVRALLVPALMKIMGAANWWAPRFVKRILPERSFGH